MEQQSQHRQNIESKVIESNIRDQRLGIIFAFIIAMSALFAAALCIFWGNAVSGTLIGTTGVCGIITSFIYGTRSNRIERQRKAVQINETQMTSSSDSDASK